LDSEHDSIGVLTKNPRWWRYYGGSKKYLKNSKIDFFPKTLPHFVCQVALKAILNIFQDSGTIQDGGVFTSYFQKFQLTEWKNLYS
jgi:hypothetical protein